MLVYQFAFSNRRFLLLKFRQSSGVGGLHQRAVVCGACHLGAGGVVVSWAVSSSSILSVEPEFFQEIRWDRYIIMTVS